MYLCCNQCVWARFPSPQLTLPSSKGQLVSLIKLFDNAPTKYESPSILNALNNSAFIDIPPVKELNGWTLSTLSRAVVQLVTKAADVELEQVRKEV